MTTVICANEECVYNGGEEKGYKCQCENISLKYRYVYNAYADMRDQWLCKNYERKGGRV